MVSLLHPILKQWNAYCSITKNLKFWNIILLQCLWLQIWPNMALSMNNESQQGQYVHTNSSTCTWATNFLTQTGTLPSTNKRWKERKGKAGRGKKHVQHSNHTWRTLWRTILLDNPRVLRLLKKFPTLYENWRFVTMFNRAHHLSLPLSISLVHTQPYSLRPILILSCSVCLSLSSGIFPLKFPCQNLLLLMHLRMWHPVARLVPNTYNKHSYCFSEHSYVFIEMQEPGTIFKTSQSFFGKFNYQN
jgi:hypothetical protein